MPTLQEISKHLQGLIPDLSPTFADDIVNQAREDLYAEKEWGFLWSDGVIRVPALVSVSTVSVVKYSRSVTLSVSAKTIIDAISIDDVPIVGRQFKVSNFDLEYTITDYNSTTGILTLDDIYLGDTNSVAKYQIYKRFFNPPEYTKADGSRIFDFQRFEAIVDVKYRWQLHLNYSNSWLNARDSSRIAEGNPFAFIPHKESLLDDGSSVLSYELYPVPKDNTERIYKVLYIRRGYNLSKNESFPNVFSKSLLIAASEIAAFKWAQIHRGQFPNLQKTNFENLIALSNARGNKNSYPNLLEQAFLRDEKMFPNALQESYLSYPFCNNPFLDGMDIDAGYYGMNETLVNSDGVMRFRF